MKLVYKCSISFSNGVICERLIIESNYKKVLPMALEFYNSSYLEQSSDVVSFFIRPHYVSCSLYIFKFSDMVDLKDLLLFGEL